MNGFGPFVFLGHKNGGNMENKQMNRTEKKTDTSVSARKFSACKYVFTGFVASAAARASILEAATARKNAQINCDHLWKWKWEWN